MLNGLPQNLKFLRSKFGYSQKQVAEKVGVSASLISGYETGERTPSASVLLALSHVYNCGTDYLFGKQSESSQITIDTSKLTTKQVNALIALIDAIIEP